MTRITSGKAKGKKLKSPNIEGFRSIQDKAKLAVFSILGKKIEDSNCLDLYTGGGNLGIEALSRGAAHCDFVDKSKLAERVIEENLRNAGLQSKSSVYRQDAVKYVVNCADKYDIVFVDPFYKDIHHRFLFENIEEILSDNGVIVFSHGKDTDINDVLLNTKHLEVYSTKRYGSAFITIIKKIG